MYFKKLPIIIVLISCLVLVGFVNSKPAKSRNLKVLPADISNERLDSLMETYNKGLGVTCDFCHTKVIKGEDTGINFEADDNPAKEVARNMIKLTMDINKKYFNYDSSIHPAYLNKVGCYTCHKGDAYPQSSE
ncbi:MAG: c-type cytochrome [Niabella sp.]|nr:MAG: c-type cytochrome [Niabella sp.]